jgi:hypothetical protein
VCVLVARAFSNALELRLTPLQEARLAYSGERETPSRCGRMDQAGCAFGPGRLVTLVFSGDDVQVEPLRRVGRTLHLVVADLNASKDTVSILRDLQEAFFSSPTTETTKTKRTTNVSGDTQNTSTTEADDREGLADRKEQERRKTGVARDLRLLLGKTNHDFVARAVDAVERGDAKTLGAVYDDAQNAFDKIAGAASPGNLGVVGSPVLHATRTNKSFEPFVFGSKGVGSQGDGSVQFLCRGATDARRCVEILRDECGAKDAFVLEVPQSADAKATDAGEGQNAAA